MDSTTLSDHVRRFLREHIQSYEQLEVLLRVHARIPEKCGTAELIQDLGLGEEATIAALDHLRHEGLVRFERDIISFEPKTPSLGEAVKDLAQAYTLSRFSVVEAMSSHAIERVRSAAILTFAEAFRIRKWKKDG